MIVSTNHTVISLNTCLFQDDAVTKLVWLVAYDVTWKDGATPVKGFGPVPGYILGIVL